MQTAYSVGIAHAPADGSDPAQLDIVELPWPPSCPVPREGDSFVGMDGIPYMVVDVQFNLCDGHGDDVFMVHVLLLLGNPEPCEHLGGTEIKLP